MIMNKLLGNLEGKGSGPVNDTFSTHGWTDWEWAHGKLQVMLPWVFPNISETYLYKTILL